MAVTQRPEEQKVLVLDDDAQYASAVRRSLLRQGFKVFSASHPADAMKLCQEHRFAAAVVDLHLPEQSGHAFAEELARLQPEAVCVMMTADRDAPQGLNGAAQALFHKPLDEERLVDTLRHPTRRDRSSAVPVVPMSESAYRILLVEDSRVDAMLFEAQVRSQSVRWPIARATTLAEAVSMLAEYQYDVIVTDLTLPDSRRVETLAKLRKHVPEAVPVIVLSSSDDAGFGLASVQSGVQDFLIKGKATGPSLVHAIRCACARKSVEAELRQLATTDALTGTLNRSGFDARLEQALSRAKRHDSRFAVAMVDLDGFKQVNDTRGHETGDALLAEVAARISHELRPYDVLARLGGDEFAVLMEDLSHAGDAQAVAQRLCGAVREPFSHDGRISVVSASVGVASFPPSGSGAPELLKAADEAMYLSKRRGKNCVTVWEETAAGSRVDRLSSVPPAKDSQESPLSWWRLEAVQDGSLLGCRVEVATPGARQAAPVWPEWPAVPARLQPYHLRLALRAWARSGVSGVLTIPIRAVDLGACFDERFASWTREAGLVPSSVRLLLAESDWGKVGPAQRAILDALAGRGVELALQLESGRLPLSELAALPLAALYVPLPGGVPEPGAVAISRAVVALGESLGWRTVALGAALTGAGERARELGCDAVEAARATLPASLVVPALVSQV